MMEGRSEEAREQLGAALSRDPFHAEGWNALGVIHSAEGRLSEAIAAWERAVEVDPRLADALYNLAAGRARNGELPEAIAAMQRYTDLVDGQERDRARQILEDLKRRAGRS
jgi:superkiller protein 3